MKSNKLETIANPVNKGPKQIKCRKKNDGFIEEEGHVVIMDNFFTSVDILSKLTTKNIYATNTISSNHIHIFSKLKDKKLSQIKFEIRYSKNLISYKNFVIT